jgi:hypothetical protein
MLPAIFSCCKFRMTHIVWNRSECSIVHRIPHFSRDGRRMCSLVGSWGDSSCLLLGPKSRNRSCVLPKEGVVVGLTLPVTVLIVTRQLRALKFTLQFVWRGNPTTVVRVKHHYLDAASINATERPKGGKTRR